LRHPAVRVRLLFFAAAASSLLLMASNPALATPLAQTRQAAVIAPADAASITRWRCAVAVFAVAALLPAAGR
jgi:hypothetical protein